jgi:carboxyl-terminal processing protease
VVLSSYMKTQNKKGLWKYTTPKDLLFFAIFTAVGIGLIGMTYSVGFSRGTMQSDTIIVQGVENPEETPVNFDEFWKVWSLLKSKYVDEQVVSDNTTLLRGAITGLVNSLQDPHTTYFTPQEAEKFNEDISGQFEGIGAEIGLDQNKQLVIIAPLKDTPASQAGLKAGDAILSIDGENTQGIGLDQAVKDIRGKRGTQVVLTIKRDGWEDVKDIAITRATIQIPTIDVQQYSLDGTPQEDGPITYIQLYNFYEKAPALFQKEALKSLYNNSQGMILDLRNNPGGYLEAAVDIAGWFTDKGTTIVTEDFQDDNQDKTFASRGPGLLRDIPIVVLINEGSASASEILAGALKELNGATIVGTTSFGKGTVQELLPLDDGAMIKITIAHWLTPEGHIIQGNGITPDIEVKDDPDTDQDEVLQRAIQIMSNK